MPRGAGALNEWVAFDAPVTIPDGKGGRETSWSEQYDCRAEFIYQRGAEQIEAARMSGTKVFKVRVRQCDAMRSVTADWRLRDLRRLMRDSSGKPIAGVYQIRTVDDITDRHWIFITVESGVAT